MATNLNTADFEELSAVPGIGKERAEHILTYRQENGAFGSWEDVKQVPGFSDELIQTIRDGGAEISGAASEVGTGELEEEDD